MNHESLMTTIAWMAVIILCFVLAWFWHLYLVKIVKNDDELQEKIRHIRREREEALREKEDRMKRKRKRNDDIQQGIMDAVHNVNEGGSNTQE